MRIVGLSGGLNTAARSVLPERMAYAHDAAASLLVDGRLVAASEQERHSRWKHSSRHPLEAIRACLELGRVDARDIDHWAYYVAEDQLDKILAHAALRDDALIDLPGRALLAEVLSEGLETRIDPAKLVFVSHHRAHALSAYEGSGFEDSLVVSYDGGGDDGHGKIFDVRQGQYELLASLPKRASLGQFYARSIEHLGYARFDEYKVMGLAPYGNASRYLDQLREVYVLDDDGRVSLDLPGLAALDLGPRRARGGPFAAHHCDLAAAIQAAFEEMAFHLIGTWQRATGHRKLCLVGGVALNCSFNGKLLAQGWFDDLFVQPAAHDAGCSLGAALHAHRRCASTAPAPALEHVYLGSPCPDTASVEAELRRWSAFVEFERCADPPARAAELLAAGKVIAWFQGRSEFGPRALGNRSILADPRPAANKDRVNAMIKKREAYRPFAPSVLEERAHEWFELDGPAHCYRYMNVVARVRPQHRELLGAVTHVDGSARVQTVPRETNPSYWRLIERFGALTGTSIVLNTSFNNFAEPIVDRPDDALACLLTTGLDHLVIDEFVVSKRADAPSLTSLIPWLPAYVELEGARLELASPRACSFTLSPALATTLAQLTRAPRRSASTKSLAALARGVGVDPESFDEAELFELWQQRALLFRTS